jgi:predicted dehydrogenase
MTGDAPLGALVVGCGAIAGGGERPASAMAPPTHADAYHRHPSYQMVSCIEPDESRRQRFMHDWNIPSGFVDLESCLAAGTEFSVASVCVPTPAHSEILRKLLDTPVRAVLCEKPLTDDARESAQLVDAYQEARKTLAVAYLRRWTPAVEELKSEFEGGVWGDVRAITGFYTKGVLNNGSHLLDLIRHLFGALTLDAVTHQRLDAGQEDPTVDAVLHLENGVPVHVMGTDFRDYALFELHIITARGAIGIEQSGRIVRRRACMDDPYHDGYKLLAHGEWTEYGHGDSFLHLLDNLKANLEDGTPLTSDGRSAFATQQLCESMIQATQTLSPACS